MTSSVNDPFLLASYSISRRLLNPKSSKNPDANPSSNIHITYTDSKSDGYATATVQGDGIHLLDISSLHPVLSHTLGPSTTFTCPAVSNILDIDGKKYCDIYIAVTDAPDVPAEDAGCVVWKLRTLFEGGLGSGSFEKMSVKMPHPIANINIHPTQVVLVFKRGDIIILDNDLNISNEFGCDDEGDRVLRSFSYPRTRCTFLPNETPALGEILVLFLALRDAIRVRVLRLAREDGITQVASVELNCNVAVTGITFSESGNISLLSSFGLWKSYRLQKLPSGWDAASISTPLTLQSLTFTAPRPGGLITSQELSLLPIHSSLVLLAAIPTSPPTDIVLLIWDLQYSVLLASHSFTMPSTLSRSAMGGIRIELVKCTESQVVLTLSPRMPLAEIKSTYRSSVLVIPINVPSTSTIANAMGRAAAGEKWIAKTSASPVNGAANGTISAGSTTRLEASQDSLLRKLHASISQKRPQAADEAFFAWVGQEEKRKLDSEGSHTVLFGYEFTKQVLEAVLQLDKGAAEILYSGKVVRALLERKVIVARMASDGLLSILVDRSDWKSALLAMETVRDLTESDIISVLHKVTIAHLKRTKSTSSPDVDAMQIDPSPVQTQDTPSLEEFLGKCVSYDTSASSLRLALRKHLGEVEETVAALQVLESWMRKWGETEDKLGVFAAFSPASEGGSMWPLPELSKVASFIQAILDASFLSLLQHPPAYPILRSISDQIEPELRLINEVEQLRIPFDSLLEEHKKVVAERKEREQTSQPGGGGKSDKGDWRKKRKEAFQQASLAVGLYQVEEIFL
ncbi:hypothetical protein BDM02DRAFT_3190540 [Thelephora ganbajun]|uniref:Uncharacterized protein n=1 Tax=Thelephora ganbajun TaxID=370292 RepID=A0ACB6Z4I4_THEGA|nr:hypothetical protein BDM02DRAFT_3190540 [Thelephora ganbajun]